MTLQQEARPRYPPTVDRRAPAHRRERQARTWDAVRAGWIAASILIGLLSALRGALPARVACLVLLLTLPGYLFLAALRSTAFRGPFRALYIPVASLLVVMVVGGVVDGIGIYLGAASPLNTDAPAWAVSAACAALACLAPPANLRLRFRRRPPGVVAAALAVMSVPVLAWLGAVCLNRGGTGAVAVAAAVLVLCLLVAAPFVPGVLSSDRAVLLILWALALAALWAFSMRGAGPYGYDIATEYRLASWISTSGVYHPTSSGGAYAAMLSITLLPACLHSVTGVSVVMLLKAVYPALFALFPAGVAALARTFVGARAGYVIGALVIAQYPFMAEMPSIARQEVGLLFFLCLLLSLADVSEHRSWPLIASFSIGLVLSHYSTAYLTGAALTCAVAAQIASWRHGGTRADRQRTLRRLLCGLFCVTASIAVWYAGVTHSTGNISETVADVTTEGFNLLPDRSGGVLNTLLYGNSGSTVNAAQYQQQVAQEYTRERPYVVRFPARETAGAPLAPAPGSAAPDGGIVVTGVRRATLVLNQAVNAAVLVGLAGLFNRALRERYLLPWGLAFGVVLVLLVLRVSGTAAAHYNPERAQIQAMAIVLIPPVALAGHLRARSRGRRARPPKRYGSMLVAGLALATLYTSSSGLLLTGSSSAGANLANQGETYDRFVMTRGELACASWLARARKPTDLVYADSYAQLRLAEYVSAAQYLYVDVTPETLDVNAWVYEDRSNVLNGIARVSHGSSLVTFRFPTTFLETHYRLVHANGECRVWHR